MNDDECFKYLRASDGLPKKKMRWPLLSALSLLLTQNVCILVADLTLVITL